MIVGIGIDSVEIERFVDWTSYDQESLKKTLNNEEIEYCIENKIKSPERFAARFASKEAFFKAFAQMEPTNTVPFLTICHNTSVTQEENGRPKLLINWENILNKTKNPYKSTIKSHISITHTKNTATVVVILEST